MKNCKARRPFDEAWNTTCFCKPIDYRFLSFFSWLKYFFFFDLIVLRLLMIINFLQFFIRDELRKNYVKSLTIICEIFSPLTDIFQKSSVPGNICCNIFSLSVGEIKRITIRWRAKNRDGKIVLINKKKKKVMGNSRKVTHFFFFFLITRGEGWICLERVL